MTGNLSRTVLRGAGARESTCLPDLTTEERKNQLLTPQRFVFLTTLSNETLWYRV